MGLSFGEIIIVIIVALLVTKPTDIPHIINKIRQFFAYFKAWHQQIMNYLANDATEIKSLNPFETEARENINFYLEKIIILEGKYEGEYSLPAVKAYYHQALLKKKVIKHD